MNQKQTIVNLKPLLIKKEDLTLITGLSESSIERLIREGNFPRQRAASKKSARWLLRDVEEWAEKLPFADFLPPANSVGSL
jgi:prophage regulatory protein